MAFGEFVGNVGQLADGVDIHLPLGASAHGPHFGAIMGHMMQDAGAKAVMPFPVAVVFL